MKQSPPFNTTLKISGTNAWGYWSMLAQAVEYKKGSTKKQLRKKYRWIDDEENVVHYVESWEHILIKEGE
jgi:hypothetical protein